MNRRRSDVGAIGRHDPVMLIVGAFSAFPQALQWARGRLEEQYGRIVRESPCFSFTETRYYEASMGGPLQKQFFALDQLIDPEALAAVKHQTNALEIAYAQLSRFPVVRPLNLDPGYLSLGKWVLASTKDHAHRISLGQGIYAEITLHYQAGGFVSWPWTYPDYQREDFQAFFLQARSDYRQRLRGGD